MNDEKILKIFEDRTKIKIWGNKTAEVGAGEGLIFVPYIMVDNPVIICEGEFDNINIIKKYLFNIYLDVDYELKKQEVYNKIKEEFTWKMKNF